MTPRTRITWLLIVGFWGGFAILNATQTWLSMMSHHHSLPRLIGFQLGVWIPWVPLSVLIFSFTRRYPLVPWRTRNILLHLALALVVALAHAALWVWLTVVILPYDVRTYVAPRLIDTIIGNAPLIPAELLIVAGVVAACHAVDFYLRGMRLERSLVEAQLHALELQIQPHFLFNTLHTVSALVRSGQNAQAVEMMAGLSDLLRYTLDHAGSASVRLEQEAAMVQRYLDLQQVRFSDRLEVRIDIADDARRAAVPALILQPLAENAVRHGLAPSASRGRIDLRAFREDGMLRIEMFNTGSVRVDAPAGIGLRNTRQRLVQLYGDRHRFELRDTEGGVLAGITIPWSASA
jgi:two-component system LytT family sensor kinase